MTHRRIIQLDGDEELHDEPQTEQPLVKIGAMVREIYMTCYRQATGKADYGVYPIPSWDGGETATGRRCRNIWPHVAAHLVKLDVDPIDFVRVQFQHAPNLHRPPTPNMLMGEAALALWTTHQADGVAMARNFLASQQNLLELTARPMVLALNWDELRAIRYCLNAPGLANLSPLFRHCAATHYGLPEIAARFYEQALIEYAFQKRIYDEVWKQLIPPPLQAAATELRARLIAF